MDLGDFLDQGDDVNHAERSYALVDDDAEKEYISSNSDDNDPEPVRTKPTQSSSKKPVKKTAAGTKGRGRGGKRSAPSKPSKKSDAVKTPPTERILSDMEIIEKEQDQRQVRIIRNSPERDLPILPETSLQDDDDIELSTFPVAESSGSVLIEPLKYETSDWESFNNMQSDKLELIKFNIYRRLTEEELDFFINHDVNSDLYTIDTKPGRKSMKIKNAGHHIIILNYSRFVDGEETNEPIIVGYNKNKLNVEYTPETLKVFEYVNRNKNVKMYIITTHKNLANIYLRKFSEAKQFRYEGLKQNKWVNATIPNKITKTK